MATKETAADKLADTAHDAVDSISASAQEAEERIRQVVAEAEKRLKAASSDAREQGEDLLENVSDYAREHPVATAGIAFAAGFLLSSLFSRR